MKKNSLLKSAAGALLLGVLALSSCVQGDMYDLLEEDEFAMGSQIPRKKLKQDFGGSTQVVSFGGGSAPTPPFPKTCAVCCAAYYASGRKSFPNDTYIQCYYQKLLYVMASIRPGFVPGTAGLTVPEIQVLTGKQYHHPGSRDQMYNEIINLLNNGAKMSDIMIHGFYTDDEDHVAILKKIKLDRYGAVIIKTWDPGTYGDVEMSSLYGYFY